MLCAGQVYQMVHGEIWALNNSARHGVWNGHRSRARTHLICDLLPSPELIRLLAEGERDLGQPIQQPAAAAG